MVTYFNILVTLTIFRSECDARLNVLLISCRLHGFPQTVQDATMVKDRLNTFWKRHLFRLTGRSSNKVQLKTAASNEITMKKYFINACRLLHLQFYVPLAVAAHRRRLLSIITHHPIGYAATNCDVLLYLPE